MSKTAFLSLLISLMFFIIPFHANSQTPFNQDQTILLNLKSFWSNPEPISHWNQSSNPCDWPEINCTGNSVTGITLANYNITGAFPPFICDLKNLTVLDLTLNYILSPFPTVLYNCSNLEYLDLSQNYFVGLIPDDISRLSPELGYLNLGANNFTGDIPASIGLLTNLTTLYLFQNRFNGSFPPEIGNLSNLERLMLSFNGFLPSRIPTSFFTQLKKLKEFKMAEANLVGEIYDSIGDLTALEFLDLSINELTGNIPSDLFLLKNLTEVYLYKNRFTGEIPQTVDALNLKVIDFSANMLTGNIPVGFGNLTQLSSLVLMFNELSGGIPVGIGQLSSLIDVRIFSNNLSGELPADFGRFSMLEVFEVATNQFNGNLPDNLCANGALLGLVVFENNLFGELPQALGSCSSLEVVRVSGNQFSGEIPTGLWTSVNLATMMIDDNLFSGQLPGELGPALSTLEISNNQFSGQIPAGVSSWKSLRVFRASNNFLGGTLPTELTALPHLETLLLDGNRLSGQFPSNIVSWNSLTTLNLSRNQLSGQIPSGIGYLHNLKALDLSQNEFSGQIPSQLGLLWLSSLNLSSNRLTGLIPGEYENGAFEDSFLNNSGLCSSNPSLGLNSCSSSQSRKSSKFSPQFVAVVASIAAVLFVLAILSTGYVILLCRRRKYGLDLNWKLISFQRLNFTESTILPRLTENNVIGSGGSGKVYRATINRSGDCVAVKRIWKQKDLDKRLEKEFLAEVEILSTIRHSNIVKLMCCISSDNSKLLVYEYLENHSLDQWLHGKRSSSTVSGTVHHVVLDWPKRLQIAAGVAQGLCYMHHDCSPPIVHRDVKSSNVLLDSDFNAKIADFGLARILMKHGELNTVSTVAGSFGYMAPEYAQTTRINEKIDVYSFGVILLELATGREANYGDEYTSLAEWAWRHAQEGKSIVDALDEDIKEPCYLHEMSSVFKLGLICTSTLPSTRPSMKEVTQILLRCSHLVAVREKNSVSEVDYLPLLKNSRHENV